MELQHPDASLLLRAYAQGVFPMADPRTGRIDYYSPDPRAVLPLDDFHVPKSLARVAKSGVFELRSDTAFERVIRACAEPRPDRRETWLDERLIAPYVELHRAGFAHSVEAWRDGELVGGLYGVHLGGAFFGESMFSRPESGGRDASKLCLVQLVEWLREGGFHLLDTQFKTAHLARFGCREISRKRYLARLEDALAHPAEWRSAGARAMPSEGRPERSPQAPKARAASRRRA